MASEYTPGPWVNDNGLVSGRDSQRPGQPSFDIYDADQWHGNTDEAHANAKLIAAAPELLEVLKACVNERHELAPALELIGKAREAINSAEGNEP